MRPFCCRGQRDDGEGGTPLPTGSALNKLGAFSSSEDSMPTSPHPHYSNHPSPKGLVILWGIAAPLTSSHDLPRRAVFAQGQQKDKQGAEFTHLIITTTGLFLDFPVVQQRADVVSGPNGSRAFSSEEPGGSSHLQILTSPELVHEVVISPGLPTPPLSPFRSARVSSSGVKVRLSCFHLAQV